MPREIDDVIMPGKRRTIRDIPIPERHRKDVNTSTTVRPNDYSFPEEEKAPQDSKKRSWLLGGFVGIVIVFAALAFFNGATLSYIPKSAPISFNKDIYTARKTGNTFTYSVVKLSKEKEKSVPASGTEEVSRKASGTIVVYNDASTEPQRLRATTRFESPDGKIYQVKDAIVVPGKSVVNGKEKPGSLEVVVYAENPGAEYNQGLSDFTLPGLKGTSLFFGVYARSKTPMSGGFMGKEAVVSSQDRNQAETELQTSLHEELMSEAKAQVPEGFIILPSLVSTTFESLPQVATATDSAVVKIRGDFAGVMFKESDLSNYLAQSKISIASGESVDINQIGDLAITFAEEEPRELVNSDEISLSVTGEALAVWRIDETALKTDISGRHKNELSSILNNYPTIVSATASIHPFWKSSFPSDIAKIKIKKLPVE